MDFIPKASPEKIARVRKLHSNDLRKYLLTAGWKEAASLFDLLDTQDQINFWQDKTLQDFGPNSYYESYKDPFYNYLVAYVNNLKNDSSETKKVDKISAYLVKYLKSHFPDIFKSQKIHLTPEEAFYYFDRSAEILAQKSWEREPLSREFNQEKKVTFLKNHALEPDTLGVLYGDRQPGIAVGYVFLDQSGTLHYFTRFSRNSAPEFLVERMNQLGVLPSQYSSLYPVGGLENVKGLFKDLGEKLVAERKEFFE